MSCDICGASYPPDGNCEQCDIGPALAPEFLPLTGLGDVLVILLGLVLTVIATVLGLRLFGETNRGWIVPIVNLWFPFQPLASPGS